MTPRAQRWLIGAAAGIAATMAGLHSGHSAEVRSRSGVRVKVAAAAQHRLQCVVNYVEAHGVRITAMRGYGRGTVRHSLHPSGRALDINQTDRNVTHPAVPHAVASAAGRTCGVISGSDWSYADNGHWNLKSGHDREPWPRVVSNKRGMTQ